MRNDRNDTRNVLDFVQSLPEFLRPSQTDEYPSRFFFKIVYLKGVEKKSWRFWIGKKHSNIQGDIERGDPVNYPSPTWSRRQPLGVTTRRMASTG